MGREREEEGKVKGRGEGKGGKKRGRMRKGGEGEGGSEISTLCFLRVSEVFHSVEFWRETKFSYKLSA
jgi:hypothetical protein